MRACDAVAEIRVRGDRRVFVATTCSIGGPLVHCVGRWRSRLGADYRDEHYSEPRTYSFNAREIERIRWLDHPRAALDHGTEIVRMP